MQAKNGDGTLLGTTSGLGLIYNVWVYVEIKVTIDESGGVVIVKANGNTVLNLSSKDTQNSANAYLNRIEYCGFCPDLDTFYDDLYILDTTGAKNNDFLGDIRVDVARPEGAGTYTDFTPSAGANYQNVDESLGPDDDTTYNDGSNVADQDTYQCTSLPSPAGTTIHGVKSQITVRKTDAGARAVKVLTRAGTTDHLSSELSLSDSYLTPAEIIEDNPDDSAAWEDADINAAEVGVEVTV